MDALALPDEQRRARTAKSCGPDPPTLGSSLRMTSSWATGAIKPGTPRRARISRNTIAQGVPEGGLKRSSQHRIFSLMPAIRQAPPLGFSIPASFSVGH
jgi:hypothetical protein